MRLEGSAGGVGAAGTAGGRRRPRRTRWQAPPPPRPPQAAARPPCPPLNRAHCSFTPPATRPRPATPSPRPAPGQRVGHRARSRQRLQGVDRQVCRHSMPSTVVRDRPAGVEVVHRGRATGGGHCGMRRRGANGGSQRQRGQGRQPLPAHAAREPPPEGGGGAGGWGGGAVLNGRCGRPAQAAGGWLTPSSPLQCEYRGRRPGQHQTLTDHGHT